MAAQKTKRKYVRARLRPRPPMVRLRVAPQLTQGEVPAAFWAGENAFPVTVADLDGDSFPDLVTANTYGHDVSVLLNLTEIATNVIVIRHCGVGYLRPPRAFPVSLLVLAGE